MICQKVDNDCLNDAIIYFYKIFNQFQDIKEDIETIIIHPRQVTIIIQSASMNYPKEVPGFLIHCNKETIKVFILQILSKEPNLELYTLFPKICTLHQKNKFFIRNYNIEFFVILNYSEQKVLFFLFSK